MSDFVRTAAKAASAGWMDWFRDAIPEDEKPEFKRMQRVVPNLYIGGFWAVLLLPFLTPTCHALCLMVLCRPAMSRL